MSEPDFSTTNKQKMIYSELINLRNPRFPRTQKEVSITLGVPITTISSAVKRFLELEFIHPLNDAKTNILYRPGKHHIIIESQINSNYLESKEWYDANGQAIRPSEHATRPYKPLFRAHINGTWLMFTVAQEGNIDRFDITKEGRTLTMPLFGSTEPSVLPGSKNYWAKIHFNNEWVSIRYQISKNNKIFYIQPSCKTITAEEITPDEDIVKPFISQVRPLLAHLEKYAGWKFKKAENGDYAVHGSVRQGQVSKSQKEYGFDDFLTNLIHDYTGDCGIIGESPIWFDRSEKAFGNIGEIETSKSDYVKAINDLPKTTLIVEALTQEVYDLQSEVAKINAINAENLRNLTVSVNQIVEILQIQNTIPQNPNKETVIV